MSGKSLLINNLAQIVQITDEANVHFLTASKMSNIKVLKDVQSSLCIHMSVDGIIDFVGFRSNLPEELADCQVLDGKGGCAIPGLVDGHTHPVFAGDRVNEFAMKLAGASYHDVQIAGGGIHFTTRKTREAEEETLRAHWMEIGSKMLASGTTTVEAKSGYGLDRDTELKMLRVLHSKDLPLEVSATFCGAHAIPLDSDERKQTELICSLLPELKKEREEGKLNNLENIDVFCEKGNFSVQSTERILKAGMAIGLRANFHAEELNYLGGAEMGAEIGASAMSHLEEISENAIEMMAKKLSVAVLLPSTAFILRLKPPPARTMIDKGVIVALGSDFNPNAHCLSMPVIMSLACVTMNISMEEALVAATINAAYSIGRGGTHGAISCGRVADVVLLSCDDWRNVIYQLAGSSHLISHVVKRGALVYTRK